MLRLILEQREILGKLIKLMQRQLVILIIFKVHSAFCKSAIYAMEKLSMRALYVRGKKIYGYTRGYMLRELHALQIIE